MLNVFLVLLHFGFSLYEITKYTSVGNYLFIQIYEFSSKVTLYTPPKKNPLKTRFNIHECLAESVVPMVTVFYSVLLLCCCSFIV